VLKNCAHPEQTPNDTTALARLAADADPLAGLIPRRARIARPPHRATIPPSSVGALGGR
jgi:hypothetical protein